VQVEAEQRQQHSTQVTPTEVILVLTELHQLEAARAEILVMQEFPPVLVVLVAVGHSVLVGGLGIPLQLLQAKEIQGVRHLLQHLTMAVAAVAVLMELEAQERPQRGAQEALEHLAH